MQSNGKELNRNENNELLDEFGKKWQNIVNILAQMLDVPSAIITRVKEPYIEVFKAAETQNNPYYNGETVKLAKHYCENVIHNKQKLEVNYAPSTEEWKNAPELKYGMVAYFGFPLFWPKGDVFGTICVLDSKENPFGNKFDELMQSFKDVVETHLRVIEINEDLKKKNEELEKSLKEIQKLQGLLPICMQCKKIRNDDGYWEELEDYFKNHTDVLFTHGLCAECEKKIYSSINK